MIRFIVDYKNIVFNGEAQYLKTSIHFSIIRGMM